MVSAETRDRPLAKRFTNGSAVDPKLADTRALRSLVQRAKFNTLPARTSMACVSLCSEKSQKLLASNRNMTSSKNSTDTSSCLPFLDANDARTLPGPWRFRKTEPSSLSNHSQLNPCVSQTSYQAERRCIQRPKPSALSLGTIEAPIENSRVTMSSRCQEFVSNSLSRPKVPKTSERGYTRAPSAKSVRVPDRPISKTRNRICSVGPGPCVSGPEHRPARKPIASRARTLRATF